MPRIHYLNFRRRTGSPMVAGDHPLLVSALTAWLLIGLLGCVVSPDLRGYSSLIGWVPFWSLLAPSVPLVVLHRKGLRRLISNGATALQRAFLVRSPQRRRRFVSAPAQARFVHAEPKLKRAA